MLAISELRRRRIHLGLTQHDLAKLAGLSQSLVAKMEAGAIDPRYSSVIKIEQALAGAENARASPLSSVMRRGVVGARRDEKLSVALSRMRAAGFSQLPILDGDAAVGLLTEAGALDALAAGKNLAALRVSEVADAPPPVLPGNTPLLVAVRVLESVPLILVRDGKKLVGVVTRSDVLGSVHH